MASENPWSSGCTWCPEGPAEDTESMMAVEQLALRSEQHDEPMRQLNRVARESEIRDLKARDNVTNLYNLATVYLIMAATIVGTLWSYSAVADAGLGWWWNIPATLIAVIIMGASQHQLGGAVHEGTHYILFENRKFNELVSDWLAAFPIYTSTYAFRLHHLAHHQFVNDPERDSNFDQAKDSGHALDFPLEHVEILMKILRQLYPPRLLSYIAARARYSAIGVDTNPYADTKTRGSRWVIRVGVLFALGIPLMAVGLLEIGRGLSAMILIGVAWAAVVGYLAVIPDDAYQNSRINPVVSHRWTAISRMTYMAVLYGFVTAANHILAQPVWSFFALFWILPLFSTFPLFMIVREWLQHGNADRGRYTNSRIILVNPFFRYAVFPWGMDYHLPHHLFASVPHYKLKDLHAYLSSADPKYAEKGLVVEGWSGDSSGDHPSIVDVLGPHYAQDGSEIHVDDHTLDDADVNDQAAIAAHIKASRAAEERRSV